VQHGLASFHPDWLRQLTQGIDQRILIKLSIANIVPSEIPQILAVIRTNPLHRQSYVILYQAEVA
jgi:hypothetical protein